MTKSVIPMTAAERKRRSRAKQQQAGMGQCNVGAVPYDAMHDFYLAAEIIRTYPHLTIGTLRDPISGKMVSLRG